MSETEKLARDLRSILKIVVFFGALSVAVAVTEDFAGHIFGADDTDSATQHSWLTLRTDYGTGCQYLEGRGGITPRLGADGRQICKAAR